MISCFELFPLGMVDGINKSGLLAKQLQKYSLHVCKSLIGQSLGFFLFLATTEKKQFNIDRCRCMCGLD